jgi:hypothetical protein
VAASDSTPKSTILTGTIPPSHLGIGRTTTYRFLQSEAFPERKGRSDAGRSSVDPWGEWVIARWNEGQRNGRQMPRDLRGWGFAGNYATVLRYLNRLRAAQDGAAPPRRTRARPGPLRWRSAWKKDPAEGLIGVQ